jgi:predicted outer membrane lipoprotein
MLLMTDRSPTHQTSDICLLLRAHGEQRWLIYEVIPVVRQLEQPDGLPQDQLGAAFAYLEALWIEARDRARDTDAAYAELEPPEPGDDYSVHEKARRYHTAVRRLRTSLAQRVERLITAPSDIPARQPIFDRYASF